MTCLTTYVIIIVNKSDAIGTRNKRYTAVLFHASCHCPETAAVRADLVSAGIDCSNLSFLGTLPTGSAYTYIATVAATLEERASAFWCADS